MIRSSTTRTILAVATRRSVTLFNIPDHLRIISSAPCGSALSSRYLWHTVVKGPVYLNHSTIYRTTFLRLYTGLARGDHRPPPDEHWSSYAIKYAILLIFIISLANFQ